MLPSVHIKKEAFLEMISAATETFKRECLGWVFGLKPNIKRKHFTITHIHHISRTRIQKNTEVQPHTRSDKRLTDLFTYYKTLYNPLGQFHSHNEWGKYLASPEMSDDDVRGTISRKAAIEIIIGVSSRKKTIKPWQVDPDGSISGSFGEYDFHFNVYTLIEGEQEMKPQKLHIVAPHAICALNRAQKRMMKKKKK